MSRGKLLGLVAVLVLLLTSMAQAADVKATGYWWMEAISRQNWNFDKGQDDHFAIEEKLRTAFTFTANENLRGVLDTQIGTANWGNGMYQISAGRTPSTTAVGGGAAGAGNIMLRRAFIEYKVPQTKVNVSLGFQTFSLPAAFGGGSAIIDDQVASAIVSAPLTDNVNLLAGYARPYDSNTAGSTALVQSSGTSTDAVFAAVPVTAGDFNVTPFGMVLIALAGEIFEFAAQIIGGQRGGASTTGNFGGVIGSILGAIAGLPFGFGLGGIAGALMGAWIGCYAVERLRQGTPGHATQAAWGAFWGRGLGLVGKTAAGAAIIVLSVSQFVS